METINANAAPNGHKIAMKCAAAYAVLFFVLIYVFKFIGLDQSDVNMSATEKAITYIATYVPFILAIVYAQTTLRTLLGGFINYGRAFNVGFRTAVYSGLLVALLMLLYYKVLAPGEFDKLMDAAVQAASDSKQSADGVRSMRPYMLPMICFGLAVNYTFFGLVISLILAAILKKPAPLRD